MSLTQSRGLAAAGRWTAVAATLVGHLEALENTNGGNVPPPPLGAVEAARRFFTFVLTGIDLDLKRSSVSNLTATPGQTTAAGISNLSIAVKVLRSEKPNAAPNDLEQVEREIRSLLNSLEQLESPNKPLPATERNALAKFLRELQHQGEIERDAAVAAQERPVSYRTSVR